MMTNPKITKTPRSISYLTNFLEVISGCNKAKKRDVVEIVASATDTLLRLMDSKKKNQCAHINAPTPANCISCFNEVKRRLFLFNTAYTPIPTPPISTR